MPESGTQTERPVSVNRNALRIVLFGMPDAGKSSLLGALAQAAQIQEHVLHGRLTDLSHGLTDLERRLYDDSPRETLEEVVPYPVTYDPFGIVEKDRANGRLEAVLVDCDGRVANDLVARRRDLLTENSDGRLGQAILGADSLILVIDASSSASQIDTDFAEFGRFLRLLEHHRGQRTDVGGLPVFLVLAKCDLLAKPTDNPASWMEIMEDRKRQVGTRFQKFLAQQVSAGPTPFGKVDVHVWATAVKRPPLVGSPARPREPFGVAELFRQSLAYARDFRSRQQKSGRRLAWTVAGTTGFVGLLIALASTLLFQRQTDPLVLELENRIKNYQAREGHTPSERLAEPLQRKISTLTEFEKDPEFKAIPSELMDYVRGRLAELEQYRAYKGELSKVRLGEVRKESDLDQIEKTLGNQLALPQSYQEEWALTDAALLHVKLLHDLNTLRKAAGELEEWYSGQVHQGEALRSFPDGKPGDASSWDTWLKQVNVLIAQSPSHSEAEEVDSTGVSYAVIYRLDRVTDLRADWEAIRNPLEHLRDLVAALGMAGKLPNGERQPLDLPEDFSAEQSRNYLQRLIKLYPNLPKAIPQMELPEAVAGDLRRNARVRYDHLTEAGREVVLRHLQQLALDGRETVELWHKLGDWLKSPEELQDWRILAALLTHLQNSEDRDPVTGLADFLQKNSFDLDLTHLTLEIPYDMKARAAGSLTIFLQHEGALTSLVLKRVEEDGRRDPKRRILSYTLQMEGSHTLKFLPGDQVWAQMPVKRENENDDWMFTWSLCRSQVYQFERLIRTPRLHLKDQENTGGKLAEGVFLSVNPPSGIPSLPDLLPVVKLEKH